MADLNILVSLNQYFKDVINMVPVEAYSSNKVDGISTEETLTSSGRKASVKRRKLNPNYLNRNDEKLDEDSDEGKLSKKAESSFQSNNVSNSITELQERLKVKIADIKKNRQAKGDDSGSPAQLTKRRKKQQPKEKKAFKKMNGKFAGHVVEKSNTETDSPASFNKQQRSDNIINRDGKVVYSKFDFGRMVGCVDKTEATPKYVKKHLSGSKNYKVLLNKAVKDKQKIEELKATNPEKALHLVNKVSWEKAAAKAEGIKLKDDPELLKKTLKRKQSIKRQSAKKWKERVNKMEENMKKQQDKRNKNIDMKKAHKKEFKKKKRKLTPGF
ncbi:unnamed protein product [Clavelina lepadiformis]|uniref:Ribosomal RNA-processing protein 14/surfeit locus protein 6 C-terminal domain-containing protein n=1 Tax=Clavelina lepadiformis TaxID=159417 RepID=A0ABP0F8S3_CLALP